MHNTAIRIILFYSDEYDDEYGAAPYIGGWSWTNYGAAEAAPAV